LGPALQADGEYEVRVHGLQHQKEMRSVENFAGLATRLKRSLGPSSSPDETGAQLTTISRHPKYLQPAMKFEKLILY
jgi:hypothetical protein